jgi:HD-like signal output (HDOD) protein
MQMWGLPDMAIDAAHFHHRPSKSAAFPEETALIHVADIFSHAMELGSSGEPLAPPLVKEAWEKLGFKPTAVCSMMKDIDRQCEEVFRIMLKPAKG